MGFNQIRLKLFIKSLDSSYSLIQVRRFILGMGMAKQFGIEVKYYASSFGIQMCNHWAPKTYLRNGTLEEWGSNQIRFKAFLNSLDLSNFLIQLQRFILGMGMAKRFGIEVKYSASSLGIQMCNHWPPITYLRNRTLEDCGVQIKFDLSIF